MSLIKSKLEKQKADLVKLEAKLAAVNTEAAAAKGAIGNLALAAEQGDPDAEKRLRQAHQTAEKADRIIADTAAALKILRAQIADSEAAERAAELARTWAEIEALGKKRLALVDDIEQQAAALKASWERLVLLSGDMLEKAPRRPAGDWNPLSLDRVADAFRSGLLRFTGWRWMFPKWPWPVEDALDLRAKIVEGNSWLLSAKGGGH